MAEDAALESDVNNPACLPSVPPASGAQDSIHGLQVNASRGETREAGGAESLNRSGAEGAGAGESAAEPASTAGSEAGATRTGGKEGGATESEPVEPSAAPEAQHGTRGLPEDGAGGDRTAGDAAQAEAQGPQSAGGDAPAEAEPAGKAAAPEAHAAAPETHAAAHEAQAAAPEAEAAAPEAEAAAPEADSAPPEGQAAAPEAQAAAPEAQAAAPEAQAAAPEAQAVAPEAQAAAPEAQAAAPEAQAAAPEVEAGAPEADSAPPEAEAAAPAAQAAGPEPSPRMVTRKRDISHATAALKDPASRGGKKGAGAGSGAGVKKADGEEGAPPAKKGKKKGGGKGGKKGGKKRGRSPFSDWLLQNGGKSQAAELADAGAEEYVRMTVAPRDFAVEDAEGKPVVLSRVYKGSSMQLSADHLAVTSWKGYRMVRATRGVQDGAWYFEISVEHLGKTGHARLGWTAPRGDIQAPVGFDAHSFSYRDLDGSKVTEAKRLSYAQPYKEGDVVGCYINLPGGGSLAPKTREVAYWKNQPFYIENGTEGPVSVPGSEIVFFLNGKSQGVAFRDIIAERYFPAASLYTLPEQSEGATVRFNFGPDFKFPPQDWEGRPAGRPVQEAKFDPSELPFDPERYKSGLGEKGAPQEQEKPAEGEGVAMEVDNKPSDLEQGGQVQGATDEVCKEKAADQGDVLRVDKASEKAEGAEVPEANIDEEMVEVGAN